jgi:hypothetical protein
MKRLTAEFYHRERLEDSRITTMRIADCGLRILDGGFSMADWRLAIGDWRLADW